MQIQTVSQSELAEFLSCSTRTVREYGEKGVLNKDCKKGKHYDLKASVRAVTDHLRTVASQHLAEADDGETLNPTVENARLNRARTRQAEVATEKTEIERDLKAAQLDLIQGNLMHMDDAYEVLARIMTSAKSKLMALANALPTRIHGMSAEEMQIVKDSVYEILIELAEDAGEFDGQVRTKAATRLQDEGLLK